MNTQIDRLGKVAITVEKDYWNRDKCYDKLVIVEKEDDCAYLSRKPVPAGISVADREYWIKIGFNTGGVVNVTTTFNPSSVTINKTTTVNISVSVNSDADTINIYRGGTLIGSGSGANYSCNDAVTPTTTSPIGYEVEVIIDGKVVTKSYSIIVNKDAAPISWSKNTDTVYIKDAASHQYPTLYNEYQLPVTYSSSDTTRAEINASTGVITIKAKGNVTITASFAGSSSYEPASASYTLSIKKNAAGLEWKLNNVKVTEFDVNLKDEFTYPAIHKPQDNVAVITYSTSDGTIATVDNNGIPTPLQEGEVDIIANSTETDYYEAGSASYKLNIANVNKLIYSYIPITNAQGIAIVNGSTQINSLFDTAVIEQNKEVTEGYIIDDGSQTSHNDEITITSPESGYYIQLFMLSNVDHKVVNYLVFAGTEYKSDIETQRYGNDTPNTIYTDNSYSYDGEDYKLIAILRRGDSNNLILIQEIQ